MADNKAWQVVQTAPFIGGLNTEVNDLQDATQYTSDELNMVIKNNGTRARRLGVDYEEGYKLSSEPITDFDNNTAFSAFEWTDISDEKNNAYIVVQMGGTLYFFRNLGEPFSQAQTDYKVDLSGYAFNPLSDDYKTTPVSFANAYGGLFVCSKAIKPFVITALTEDPISPPIKASVKIPLKVGRTAYWTDDGFTDAGRTLNPEIRFSIDDVAVGISQIQGESTEKWREFGSTQLNNSPVFTPYFLRGHLIDDFGSIITNPLGLVVTGGYKNVIFPTARYYARLWNSWRDAADPSDIISHITAIPETPFSGDFPDWNDIVDEDVKEQLKYNFYWGIPIEFIKFECDAGVIYEGLKIKLEIVEYGSPYKSNPPTEYTTGAYVISATTAEGIPKLSQGITKGYKTPNVDFTLDVQIRDFKGVKDIYHDTNIDSDVDLRYGEAVSTEPFLPYTLGDVEAYDEVISNHCYNLFNQGWNGDTLKAFKDIASNQQTIDGKVWTKYPANNYEWYAAQDPATLNFKPKDLIEMAFGNTRAPTGRGIVSYLKQDRKYCVDSVSNSTKRIVIDDIPIEYPRTPYFVDIISYAGRLWYLSGDIVLYSQVLLDDITKADKCYQEADPTSQKISDLVDTDGGMIQIPELGDGIRFCLVGGALAVVGTKSIQLISGGQNNAFTATAYVRGAMQAYTTISPRSFVTTEYGTFFWSDVGVVLLSYQEGFAAQNITESTINTFYQKIPNSERKNCVGIYNRAQKQIVWMYGEGNNLKKLLIYDILKNAWTPFEIADTIEKKYTTVEGSETTLYLPAIVGGVTLDEAYKVESIYPIYAEVTEEITPSVHVVATEPVVTVDENGDVIWRVLADDPIEKEDMLYKSAVLLCYDKQNAKVTFGNFDNLNCLDWAAGDIYGPGVNYNSYLVSHPINLNSTSWNKTIPYLLTYFRRTETGYTTEGEKIYPSACQGAIQWDWNNSGKAGKWDAQQELYRYDKHFNSYTVVDEDGNLVMTLAEDFDKVVDGVFADAVNIVDPIEKGTLLENDYVFSKTRIYGDGRAFKVKLSSVDNNYFIVENVGFNIYGDARI